MKKLVFLSFVLLFLSGCAYSKQIILPNGAQGYSITCDGAALNWGDCYKKAGEKCNQRGYYIVEKSGDTGTAIGGGQYGFYGASTAYRNMLIQCK